MLIRGFAVLATLLFAGMKSNANAEVPKVEQLIAEATRAAEALSAQKPERIPEQRALQRQLQHQAWATIANAHVQRSEFDAAVAAFNHINADSVYSEMAVQVMRVEATGELVAGPDDIPPRFAQLQREALINALKSHKQFEKAFELVEQVSDKQRQVELRLEVTMARAKAAEEADRLAALEDYAGAIKIGHELVAGEYVELLSNINEAMLRMGPPEGALPTIRISASLVERYESKMSRTMAVQEWLRLGRDYLRAGDEDESKKCFARSQMLFEKSGEKWDSSVPGQLKLHFLCRAYRELGRPDDLKATLNYWQTQFEALDDKDDITFVAPFLLSHLIRAGRLDDAAKLLKGQSVLDRVGLHLKTLKSLNEVYQPETDARRWTAKSAVELSRDVPDFRVALLTNAAETQLAIGDQADAEETFNEALAASEAKGKNYHELLAGWCAEAGWFDRCYELCGKIDEPAKKAIPLSQLALELAKRQRTPALKDSQ